MQSTHDEWITGILVHDLFISQGWQLHLELYILLVGICICIMYISVTCAQLLIAVCSIIGTSGTLGN